MRTGLERRQKRRARKKVGWQTIIHTDLSKIYSLFNGDVPLYSRRAAKKAGIGQTNSMLPLLYNFKSSSGQQK